VTELDPSLEAPHADAATTDAVTFSFGDREAELYGIARAGLSLGEDGTPQASGLALLFAGREPVTARAAGGLDIAELSWDAVDAGGVTTRTLEPLRRWQVTFTGEDDRTGFDLTFTARSAPAWLSPDSPVGRLGGMQGYEQLCHVTGSVRARGGDRQIECLGQRGHSWGAPDWEQLSLVRTVNAWMDDDLGVSLSAIRDARGTDHGAEALGATRFAPASDEEDATELVAARDILEPRVSTTYDADGRQRRASLELFETEESWPRRVTGEVHAGTTLDLDRLRLDCAFFHWEMEGRHGVGRYDILRRA
jgi:hypothetical protein